MVRLRKKAALSFAASITVIAASMLITCQPVNADANEGAFVTSSTLFAAPSGTGNQSGSDSANAKELQAAINAVGTNNTKIVLANGYYRNYYSIGSGTNVLILEAATPGEAIFTGSDRFTAWTDEGSGFYSVPWANNWGLGSKTFSGNPEAVNLRKEMVFIDGTRLRQVANNDSTGSPVAMSSLAVGQFTVDETNNKIFFQPPTGTTVTSSTDIQVAVRGTAEHTTANGDRSLLKATSHSNLAFRGLIFEHSANYVHGDAALDITTGGVSNTTSYTSFSSNILVDNCKFRQNNGIGLDITKIRNATIKKSSFDDNGERGGGSFAVHFLTVQDCSMQRNNWRFGHWLVAHDAAGWKHFDGGVGDYIKEVSQNLTFIRCNMSNNQCDGFWQDYGGPNTLLAHCLFENNAQTAESLGPVHGYGTGIHNEMSPAITLTDSVVRRNGDTGVNTTTVPNLVIKNSYLYDNGGRGKAPGSRGGFGNEISFYSDSRVSPTPGVTLSLEGFKLTGNTIASFGGTSYESGYMWGPAHDVLVASGKSIAQEIAYNVQSNYNTWSKSTSDYYGDKGFFSLNNSTNRVDINFAAWQAQSNKHGRQDLNSTFVERNSLSLSNVPSVTTTSFSDDFEANSVGGNASNWTTDSNPAGYSVVSTSSKRYRSTNDGTAVNRSSAGSTSWNNYQVTGSVRPINMATDGTLGIYARYTNTNNFYGFVYNNAIGKWTIVRRQNGVQSVLATGPAFSVTLNQDYLFKLTVKGSTLTLNVNGTDQCSVTDTAFTTGKVAVTSYKATADFDNIIVAPQ